MCYRIIRPLLFLLPPEIAHHITLSLLKLAHQLGLVRAKLADSSQPIKCSGLEFPNAIGLAAGLDKNGDYIDALAALGFGFIEIGTVTPKPQPGNPKPRLHRIISESSLVNRMGFNNKGVDYLVERVKTAKFKGVLGINIGKNATTPNERAVDDYLTCLNKVYPYASYITINISSPNTKDLRALQHGKALESLLQALLTQRDVLHQESGRYVPLWVKIAPDLGQSEIQSLATTFNALNIDAVIATNTLASRAGLEHIKHINTAGGISGKLVQTPSTTVLTQLRQHLNQDIAIIGVGGIDSKQAAQDKFQAGAELIQVYTGLIYQGPGLIKRLVQKH